MGKRGFFTRTNQFYRITNRFSIADGGNVWIGFNDIQDESVFNWADGRQVKYTNWGLNQPSHTANANQDCVLMQNKVSTCGPHHFKNKVSTYSKNKEGVSNVSNNNIYCNC